MNYLITIAILLAGLSTIAAAEARITLNGGTHIVASVIKKTDAIVVVDLGYDVLSIPVENIQELSEQTTELETQVVKQGIYQLGTLAQGSATDIVSTIGDAVLKVSTPNGLGSGFLISDEGHLLTNYHVVERETKIRVSVFQKNADGYQKHELTKVRVLAIHPMRDLALLQIDLEEVAGLKLPHVTFSEQDDVAVGDRVVAVGNPLGLERSVTQGIISSRTRTLGHLRFLQTDASINPGNSGGPMFNHRGEVIGVVCAGHTFFDGLAFGIPATDVIDFLRNREAFLYDTTNPQNGITYLPPPTTLNAGETP